MKRIMGNILGFTLVELMVVVAIIGILSTVAIPNFKRYQAKAKTSEAKLALAAVYSNETSFLSEWDTYSTCLKDGMGIVAPPRGYYSFGFTADAQLSVATTNGAVSCITGGYSFAPVTVVPVGGSTAATTDISGGTLTSTSFTAGAAGHISADTTGLDKWTINQDKQIKNITAGF